MNEENIILCEVKGCKMFQNPKTAMCPLHLEETLNYERRKTAEKIFTEMEKECLAPPEAFRSQLVKDLIKPDWIKFKAKFDMSKKRVENETKIQDSF